MSCWKFFRRGMTRTRLMNDTNYTPLPHPSHLLFFFPPLLLIPCFHPSIIPRFPPMFKVPLVMLLNMDGVGMRPWGAWHYHHQWEGNVGVFMVTHSFSICLVHSLLIPQASPPSWEQANTTTGTTIDAILITQCTLLQTLPMLQCIFCLKCHSFSCSCSDWWCSKLCMYSVCFNH